MKCLIKLAIVSARLIMILLLIISCNEKRTVNAACTYFIVAKKRFIDYIEYNPLRYSFQKGDYGDLAITLMDNDISEEIIFNSEVSVAAHTIPVTIFGINCTQDPLIEAITMIEGDYREMKIGEIIFNRKIADFLDVKVDDKVVLVFKDYDGIFNACEYSVKGIYELKLEYRIDAIMDVKAVNEMLGMHDRITNYIIHNKDGEKALKKIKENHSDLDVFCIHNE